MIRIDSSDLFRNQADHVISTMSLKLNSPKNGHTLKPPCFLLHRKTGKPTENYGKFTMLLMGKLTISMAIFNSYVKLPEGKDW